MKKYLTINFKIVLLFLTVLLLLSCTDNKEEKRVVDDNTTTIKTDYLEESGTLKAVGGESSDSATTSESEVSFTGTLSDDL